MFVEYQFSWIFFLVDLWNDIDDMLIEVKNHIKPDIVWIDSLTSNECVLETVIFTLSTSNWSPQISIKPRYIYL